MRAYLGPLRPRMSYCIHSFLFLQREFFPRPNAQRLDQMASMGSETLSGKAKQMAHEDPVKFVATASFLALGAVPLAGFLAYAVVTLIATIIGGIIVQVALLGLGIACLAFVLVIVGCLTGCIVSGFATLYYSYRFASGTLQRASRRGRAPFSSPPPPDSEPSLTETEQPYDKTK